MYKLEAREEASLNNSYVSTQLNLFLRCIRRQKQRRLECHDDGPVCCHTYKSNKNTFIGVASKGQS